MAATSFESFKYGNEVVGGATPTHTTRVIDSYMFVTTQDDAEFVCRFAVEVAPSGNAVTDYNALTLACQAVEAALRMRYQRLEVDWGATANPVEVFDPAVGAGTFPSSGFSHEPHLEKIRDFPNSGEARGYEFRVSMGQYPNYTDAYGAANGRRQVSVSFHYDVDQRLIVTMTGQWTQVPASLARAKFLAIFYGNTGYASYRLGLIDSTEPGASGDTWAITRREESDPNDLSTLTFSVEFQQHVNGRRGSTIEVLFGPQGLRTVTIRGTYLRTVAGTNYGSAASSLANYLDPTNGGQAYAVGTQLPGLTTQGGALVVGQNCELLAKPFETTNEQQDRTEYNLVYQELIQKQSLAAGSFVDDPNIVGDSISVAVQFNEVNDSPAPPALPPGPGGAAAAKPSGAPDPGGPPASVEKVTGAPASQGGGGASLVVSKPVDLFVAYEAFFKKSVTNCWNYFTAQVLPVLLEVLINEFGPDGNGGELVTLREKTTRTKNMVSAELHLRVYNSNVVLFEFTQGVFNELGIRADPAFSGTPHDYLVQQGLPKTTMTRRIRAISKAGTFSLDQFVTPPALSGWVPLANAQPETITRVLGIPNQGVIQQPLTYATLDESLLWVRSNVGSGGKTPTGGGGGGPSIPTGGLTPPPVAPPQATGVG